MMWILGQQKWLPLCLLTPAGFRYLHIRGIVCGPASYVHGIQSFFQSWVDPKIPWLFGDPNYTFIVQNFVLKGRLSVYGLHRTLR